MTEIVEPRPEFRKLADDAAVTASKI